MASKFVPEIGLVILTGAIGLAGLALMLSVVSYLEARSVRKI